MTTTSQQPPAGDRGPNARPGGGPEGGARPGGGPRGGRDGRAGRDGRGGALAPAVFVVCGVIAGVAAIAAIAWVFLAGPLSSSAQAEREVGQTLERMSSAESFDEFNSHMCAENRVPQDLVDTITASSEATGPDLDAMFRESIAGSFPQDLEVTGVEIAGDGSEATATVESESDGSGPEQVRMRDEDGAWKLCQPGVGMGSVPEGQQPG